MPRKVLVVSAHIGDEILGCGGTLKRHADEGDCVRVVVLGEGWTSRTKSLAKGLEAVDLQAFEQQGRSALRMLSIDDVRFHRLPDNRFDKVGSMDLVNLVETHKAEFQPDCVYTNTAIDLGVDQRMTCEAVLGAFGRTATDCCNELYVFEVLSSSNWEGGMSGLCPEMNHFVDITVTMPAKIDALRALKTEMRPWPHSRSLENVIHQARVRGATVGCDAAEAFTVLRSTHRSH